MIEHRLIERMITLMRQEMERVRGGKTPDVWARGQVAALVKAAGRVPAEEAATEIAAILDRLTEFYPQHIRREDKQLFPACMRYFTDEEKTAMIAEEYEFDRKLIHEKYRGVVESLVKGGD
jgi:hemerythrin-like domain-containing protein